MTHRFEFTDEEVDVLAFVLWSEDNNLAMLPPGQFVEQAKQVRVVARLAHEFEQRKREIHAIREAELADKVMKIAYNDDGGLPDLSRVVRTIIQAVREHDNPPEPVPEQDAQRAAQLKAVDEMSKMERPF